MIIFFFSKLSLNHSSNSTSTFSHCHIRDYLDGGVTVTVVRPQCFLRFWNCFCMQGTSHPVPSASCLSLQVPRVRSRETPGGGTLRVLRLRRESSHKSLASSTATTNRFTVIVGMLLDDFHFHSIVRDDRPFAISG